MRFLNLHFIWLIEMNWNCASFNVHANASKLYFCRLKLFPSMTPIYNRNSKHLSLFIKSLNITRTYFDAQNTTEHSAYGAQLLFKMFSLTKWCPFHVRKGRNCLGTTHSSSEQNFWSLRGFHHLVISYITYRCVVSGY